MSATQAPAFFTAHIQSTGEQFDAWDNQPLLMSLEQGGLEWPSSCRNGTCRTCIAQLESGQVRYQIDWPGLSAEEKQDGYVLPCVAFPCTDVVLSPGGE